MSNRNLVENIIANTLQLNQWLIFHYHNYMVETNDAVFSRAYYK